MSSTVVYGCDWCKEIVPKKADEPCYAAIVVINEGAFADGGIYTTNSECTKKESICKACRKALEALREGRYRRG